jgi:multidrug efflux system membrane fusion protein
MSVNAALKRRSTQQLALLVVSLVLGFAYTGCRDAASTEKALTPVRVGVVQSIPATGSNTYSANIQPYQQVELAFKSNGYLKSIRQVKDANGKIRNIDAGDWVTKGTVLATVTEDDYQQKLQQANAQLARAQANSERAKLSFDRMSVLYKDGAATVTDYDNTRAQMLDTQASIESAKASIAEQTLALQYCQLRAPFDGWIVKRNVDEGQLVGPATNGFTISDVRSVKAVFGVPDTAMEHIRLGSPETITTDAVSGDFAGHVTSISPSADPKSRVYSVEVTIPNNDNRLKAGMIASITIRSGKEAQKVDVISLAAVVRSLKRPDGFAVFMPDGTGDTVRVHTQEVELGATYGNNIAVESGLKPGDRVVTYGATMIKDGQTVRVIE